MCTCSSHHLPLLSTGARAALRARLLSAPYWKHVAIGTFPWKTEVQRYLSNRQFHVLTCLSGLWAVTMIRLGNEKMNEVKVHYIVFIKDSRQSRHFAY